MPSVSSSSSGGTTSSGTTVPERNAEATAMSVDGAIASLEVNSAWTVARSLVLIANWSANGRRKPYSCTMLRSMDSSAYPAATSG